MEIKKGTEEHTPAIVELLKVSLGETLMPKSEAYWKWKHIDNPFGHSPCLIAVDNNKVIGVRAFMRWQWRCEDRQLEAVRAVDTATHPDYQGRGIFSKLTKSLLEECTNAGLHIVFNTPNNKSLPGYLKMGWEKAGRLPVSISLPRPFGTAMNIFKKQSDIVNQQGAEVLNDLFQHPEFPGLLEANRIFYGKWITNHTINSLKWRYMDVPAVKYYYAALNKTKLHGIVIYRIKTASWGSELRVTDFFIRSKEYLNDLKKLLLQKAHEHRTDIITISGLGPFSLTTNLISIAQWKIGPEVTIRNITLQNLDDYLQFKNWNPSLGDLELF